MTDKKAQREASFEQSIEFLEQIIDRIESGQIGLQECLAEYEQGMKLIQRCQTILTAAQKKMAELKVDFDGKLQEDNAAVADDEVVQADDDPDDEEENAF